MKGGAGKYSWKRLRDADPSYKPKRSIKIFPHFNSNDVEYFFEGEKLSFNNLSDDRCGVTINLWPDFPSHFMME